MKDKEIRNYGSYTPILPTENEMQIQGVTKAWKDLKYVFYFICTAAVLFLCYFLFYYIQKWWDISEINNGYMTCNLTTGVIGPQLQFKIWRTESGFKLPYYSSGSLDEALQHHIVNAVVIQHGFLRNGDQYFCAAYDALYNLTMLDLPDTAKFNNTIIITPQFLIDGDLCWDKRGELYVVDTDSNPMADCGLPIWPSNNSWIDGELNFNPVNVDGLPRYLYSYEVYDMLIYRLSDPIYFPNLKNITIFGFSAGAQLLQRYLLYPNYDLNNPGVVVSPYLRFVISDPSLFPYFNDFRPYTNGSSGFAPPDPTWIPDQWAISNISTNSTWIESWDQASCETYDYWRDGLEDITGYLSMVNYSDIFNIGIPAYNNRDITYMIGYQDTCNCNFEEGGGNTEICYYASFNGNNGTCDDNYLDTTCAGMLQGPNRYVRMIHWMSFLEYYYGENYIPRPLVSANVGHDYVGMIQSPQGLCVIFGYGCDLPGVFNITSDTPDAYEMNDFNIF